MSVLRKEDEKLEQLGHYKNNATHDLGQNQAKDKSKSLGQHGGHKFLNGQENSSPIRKYLVLLQDCFAIKFVEVGERERRSRSRTSNRIYSETNKNYENKNRSVGGAHAENYNGTKSRNYNYAPQDHHQKTGINEENNEDKNKNKSRPSSSLSFTQPFNYSSLNDSNSPQNQIDHSTHGLFLYKSFCEANLQCYWNTGLHDAFQHLQYKGYILPSTVLIWAIPRFLNSLRTAWSRQMLRSPPGYRIEFIGEIEDLIAEPIQKSQFAPLSDSLCWVILEITSLGQEAFVDSILQSLSLTFPKMVPPSREVVYLTLENLIRERKIYQTSNGYFIVTPDTFRYMLSSSPTPYNHLYYTPTTFSTNTLTIDNMRGNEQQDLEILSRNSWDSTASADNGGFDKETDGAPLRRHNSLKIIRQRDKEPKNSFKLLRGRSLSLRLYKSKSTTMPNSTNAGKERDDKIYSKENVKPLSKMSLKDDENVGKSKSGKSFFKKLFKRSSSKKRSESADRSPCDYEERILTKTSIQTQTTSSTEDFFCLTSEPRALKEDKNRAEISVSDIKTDSHEPELDLSNKINPNFDNFLTDLEDRSHFRPPSRLSSVIDDASIYATPKFPIIKNGSLNSGIFPPKNFPNSSRSSTLSQNTSLGYGSQGANSNGFQSPSPSSKNSLGSRTYSNYGSYRNTYDYYRRRYPSYNNPNNQHNYESIIYPVPRAQNSQNVSKTKEEVKVPLDSSVRTTRVTQNLKSTTNMEVEVRLPLGQIIKTSERGNNLKKESSESGKLFETPKNSTETQIQTTVNTNGVVETHFNCYDSNGNSSKNNNSVNYRVRVTDLDKGDNCSKSNNNEEKEVFM